MNNSEKQVAEVMGKPFPTVDAGDPISKLSQHINNDVSVLLARKRSGNLQILTNYDIARAL